MTAPSHESAEHTSGLRLRLPARDAAGLARPLVRLVPRGVIKD